tara:strand:+ start:84 stop:1298 length:1215 start_codon:yes stop_codon:yes gene_type:complete
MAIDWNAARRHLTGNEAYRGTGKAWPSRRSRNYGATQGRGGQGNVWRPSTTSQRQPGIGAANIRPRPRNVGGIWDAVKAGGRKITPWMADIAGKVGDTFDDAMRGSRLHQSYQDDLGRVAGHKEWEKDKRSMMTDEDRAFEKKYLNLASMAQDNQKAQEYKDIAETAWRNKQTSDRLSAIKGFEGYAPGKYTGVGEGSRYTGDVYEGQGRTGKHVPGVQIMRDLLGYGYGEGTEYAGPGQTIGAAGGPIPDPDMDITADLGGPLTPAGGPIPGVPEEKPRPDDYWNYPDEDQLSPFDPWADIYDFEKQRQKAYFTPKLLDEDRMHPTLPLGPRTLTSAPGEVTYPYGENLLDQPRTWNPGSAAAMNARGQQIFPNISVEFTGDEEENNIINKKVNPWWNKAYGG